MKTLKSTLLLLTAVLLLFSCRTEEIKIIDPPAENALVADSPVSRLMLRTVLKDGSEDNIVDNASCLSIKLPVTVIANSKEIVINNEEGYEEIEDIFNLFDDDVDSVKLVYPVTVILSNHSTFVVESDERLRELASECEGENEEDDDIECLDFEYPFSASVFNENNDLILTITFEEDEDLYELLENLGDYSAVTINFPIKVKLAEDTVITINNLEELEEAIEAAANTCDEDDDNDFDDDDCDDCTTEELKNFFAECEEWRVDLLKVNGEDHTDYYESATFYFRTDNTLKIIKAGNIYEGEWGASGEENEIDVTINVEGFDMFNKTWSLHEISDYQGEFRVDLRLGDDRLRFESFCNNGSNNEDELSEVLTAENSVWMVEQYLVGDDNKTSEYTDYKFYFYTSGVVKAKTDNTVDEGEWKSLNEATKFYLTFSTNELLKEFNNDDWKVVEILENQVKLEAPSDNGTKILLFAR